MRVLEIFSGTASFSEVAKELGHTVLTIDNNAELKPDICMDILDNKIIDIIQEFKPELIWFSPPCTTFSVAGRNTNYINFVPQNVGACLGLACVLRSLEIINICKPKYWFIENPRGYLRKFPIMQKITRKTVTYCKYGFDYMKPTDIWTNNINFIPKKPCKNGDNCHVRAPRGSRAGIQGIGTAKDRGVIPRLLSKEIIDSCNGDIKQRCLSEH